MKLKAVFIGRFQPFHNGHLSVVKKMSQKYRLLIVIGSTNRKSGENPFSSRLRQRMIHAALTEAGIKDVVVIPMPDTRDDKLWAKKFLRLTKNPDLVVTGNPWVMRCLKSSGVRFLKIKEKGRKITATKIRAAMHAGKPWKQMVPRAVVKFLEKINLKDSLAGK